MTRTRDDTWGYGGAAVEYVADDWCMSCKARVVWPEGFLAHADRHVATRNLASERADAEQAELSRQLRRERDMRRGGRE